MDSVTSAMASTQTPSSQATPSQATSEKTGFQDLPTELRLMVYANISPPLTGHMTHSLKGFMLSSKAIKHELEHTVVGNMVKYLNEMKKEWNQTYGSNLMVSTPHSALDVKEGCHRIHSLVLLQRPRSYFPAPTSPAHSPSSRQRDREFVRGRTWTDEPMGIAREGSVLGWTCVSVRSRIPL